MKHFRLEPGAPLPQLSEEEWKRIDALAERGAPSYYEDCPELDADFFRRAERAAAMPAADTVRVTMRLDGEVVRWLKKPGPGYQTRINKILRLAMEGPESRAASQS
jgi:uncharacterized protein (DUF4415 family)